MLATLTVSTLLESSPPSGVRQRTSPLKSGDTFRPSELSDENAASSLLPVQEDGANATTLESSCG